MSNYRSMNASGTALTMSFACMLSDSHPASGTPGLLKYHYVPDYQVLEEEITPNSTGSRSQWKPFQHYKCWRADGGGGSYRISSEQWEYLPHAFSAEIHGLRACITGFNANGALQHPFGEPGLPIQGLPAFRVPTPEGYFVPSPDDLEQLKQRSLNAMLPLVKANLSIINSIIELKDFKSLATSVISKLHAVRNGSAWGNLVLLARRGNGGIRYSKATNPTLRQSLGATSGSYLQAKFNYLPLLSDISAIHAALSQTQRRINDLVSRSGRPQTSHFGYKWDEFVNKDENSPGHLALGQFGPSLTSLSSQHHAFYLRRQTDYSPTYFHAELQYNYNYTAYQVANAQLLGHLDAFGVNLNPAIIWNAIPWSFVVDWVFGVSRFLDQFKVLNLEPKINIRRYLWSVSRRRTMFTSVHPYRLHSSYPEASATGACPPTFESAYRRDVGLPTLSSILASGLSLSEISLGAALITSRKSRRRR